MPFDQGARLAQQHLQESVITLREVPASELHATFEPGDINLLDQYQSNLPNAQAVVQEPISPDFKTKYGDAVRLLTGNTSYYDEEQDSRGIENHLDSDMVIQALMKHRETNGDSIELGDARRARRSVAIYLLTREVVVEQLKKESTTEGTGEAEN